MFDAKTVIGFIERPIFEQTSEVETIVELTVSVQFSNHSNNG